MSTYTPIATQTLGSAAASVTFSSIPQGYTDLVIVVGSATFSANSSFYMQYNGDTSTNYSSTRLSGNGSAASSSRTTSVNGAQIGAADGQSSSVMQTCIVQLQNYSNATTFKTAIARWNRSDAEVAATVSLWRSTAAITSIEIYGGFANGTKNSNMQSGTTISLYGIQVGDKAQKAQGGNIVTSDGTYVYHTFTSSGSFITNEALTADYLVVAGGGAGGSMSGGGGGGLRSTVTATGGDGSLESALSLSANKSYPVIVGAGGAQVSTSPAVGGSGGNSVFGSITSIGGGGGGGYSTTAIGRGADGGSGGGSSYDQATTPRGLGTANQGYNGGISLTSTKGSGGGGGGAGAIGGDGTATTGIGGSGGNGVAVAISGSSVTYAGGGGGSGEVTAGAGGSGGGGAGRSFGSSTGPFSGTANTGGGGGGPYHTNGLPSGNGGSGIVIIRYAL
jgi:hypothetical protein